MARALRILIPDGWYHVFHRGTQRREIFLDDRDRMHFLELLGDVYERYRFRIHAYALMTTHYHAIVQTPDANLSAGMQWLHLSHAAWFNARHDTTGPFWQGRFRSVPVEDGAWACELSLYVHLNPLNIEAFGLGKQCKRVEALGLRSPTAEEVSDRLRALRNYRWSSYRAYGGYEKGPKWLCTEAILERASSDPAERRRQYRETTKSLLSKSVEETGRERLNDALAVGGEAFRDKIKRLAGGGDREIRGKRELRRRVSFEDVVRAVEQVKGEKYEEFVNRRGDWGLPLVMWLARRCCGMTLQEIGAELGGKDYAAVSDRLRRFERDIASSRKLERVCKDATRFLNLEI